MDYRPKGQINVHQKKKKKMLENYCDQEKKNFLNKTFILDMEIDFLPEQLVLLEISVESDM